MQQFACGFNGIGSICGCLARCWWQDHCRGAPAEARPKREWHIALPQTPLCRLRIRPFFRRKFFSLPSRGRGPAANSSAGRELRWVAPAGLRLNRRHIAEIFNHLLKSDDLSACFSMND
jgi:hypothetical protein